MKLRPYFLLILLLTLILPLQAETLTFLAKENTTILQQEGDITSRYSPCSTFKIALSLMGYDAKILEDETHPQWPYKADYEAFLESWKQPQNPTTWIKNSCVWYSQVLTKKLGMRQFQTYVNRLNYGNKDLSGDKEKHNGLTHAWLSSSLTISPQEQAVFLQKLLDDALPVSIKAHHMTKAVLFVDDLPNGWQLYGKTGSGYLSNKIKHGWFVGWIEKGERKIVFVCHLIDDKKQESHAGPRAKAKAREKLMTMIQSNHPAPSR
jgi:beta-lactamase class D